MPGIAVVSIFNFVFSWAEFVMAFTILNDSSLFTIAMGVYSFQGQYSTDYRAIAAASVIAMIPLLVMFISLQRYFVSGLTEGAVKGITRVPDLLPRPLRRRLPRSPKRRHNI